MPRVAFRDPQTKANPIFSFSVRAKPTLSSQGIDKKPAHAAAGRDFVSIPLPAGIGAPQCGIGEFA
jgi:hypothetical protein